jgi:hypothetical protein
LNAFFVQEHNGYEQNQYYDQGLKEIQKVGRIYFLMRDENGNMNVEKRQEQAEETDIGDVHIRYQIKHGQNEIAYGDNQKNPCIGKNHKHRKRIAGDEVS